MESDFLQIKHQFEAALKNKKIKFEEFLATCQDNHQMIMWKSNQVRHRIFQIFNLTEDHVQASLIELILK